MTHTPKEVAQAYANVPGHVWTAASLLRSLNRHVILTRAVDRLGGGERHSPDAWCVDDSEGTGIMTIAPDHSAEGALRQFVTDRLADIEEHEQELKSRRDVYQMVLAQLDEGKR